MRALDGAGLILLPREVALLRRLAEAEYPKEAVAALLVREPASRVLWQCDNVARDPTAGFQAAPADWQAVRAALLKGYDLLAVFHSHCDGSPVPSDLDVAVWRKGREAGGMAQFIGRPAPEPIYVVANVERGRWEGATAWRWEGEVLALIGRVEEGDVDAG